MDLPGSPLPRPGPRRRAFRSGFAAPQFRTNTSRPCPPSTSRSGPSSPRGTSSAARSPTMSSGGAVRHPGRQRHRRRGSRCVRRLPTPRPRSLHRPGPERPAGTHISELDQYRPTSRRPSTTCTHGRSWRTRRRDPHLHPRSVAQPGHRHRPAHVLATAYPAKFAETVEPLIGQALPVPPGIASVMDRPLRSIPIAPELKALREVPGAAHTPDARERNA